MEKQPPNTRENAAGVLAEGAISALSSLTGIPESVAVDMLLNYLNNRRLNQPSNRLDESDLQNEEEDSTRHGRAFTDAPPNIRSRSRSKEGARRRRGQLKETSKARTSDVHQTGHATFRNLLPENQLEFSCGGLTGTTLDEFSIAPALMRAPGRAIKPIDKEGAIPGLIQKMNDIINGDPEYLLSVRNSLEKDPGALLVARRPREIAIIKILFPSASNLPYYQPDTLFNSGESERKEFQSIDKVWELSSRCIGSADRSGENAGIGPTEPSLLEMVNKDVEEGARFAKNLCTYFSLGLCGSPDALSIEHSRVKGVAEFKSHGKKPTPQTNKTSARQLEIYLAITRCREGQLVMSYKNVEFACTFHKNPLLTHLANNPKYQPNMMNKDSLIQLARRHRFFLEAAVNRGLQLNGWPMGLGIPH